MECSFVFLSIAYIPKAKQGYTMAQCGMGDIAFSFLSCVLKINTRISDMSANETTVKPSHNL